MMRAIQVGLGALAGLLALGMTAAGCGELWHPFLTPIDCAGGGACADQGGTASLDLAITDMGPSPWQREPSGTTQNLHALWGVQYMSYDGGVSLDMSRATHTDVWAVGDSGTILRRGSVAGTWAADPTLQTSRNLYAINGRSIFDYAVVGDQLYSAVWQGSQWMVTSPLSSLSFNGITPSEASNYLAGGSANTVYSINAAARTVPSNYSYQSTADVTAAATIATGGQSFLGGGSGDILAYKWSTATFSSYGLQYGLAIRSIWAESATAVWAVGDGGLFVHYDGVSWTPVALPFTVAPTALRGVTGASGTGGKVRLWVVGDGGTILYSDGQSWMRWQDGAGVSLRGVWYDSATDGVWIVGDQGTILHDGTPTR